MRDRNRLSRLAGVIISSALLVSDHGAKVLTTKSLSQANSVDVQKNPKLGEIELIIDASDVAQVMTSEEKFSRGLDELNRKMPRRITSSLELDVTEMLLPFLPKSGKIEDAIIGFRSMGLSPQRDKGGSHTYFTYFSVPYDRLAAQGRTRFLPGDRLVINYTAASPEVEAEIIKLNVTLLNDRFL